MANTLNRELRVGDKVVFTDGQEATIVADTFGTKPYLMSTAVIVDVNGHDERRSGLNIDADLTMQLFGEVNGWVKPDATEPTMADDLHGDVEGPDEASVMADEAIMHEDRTVADVAAAAEAEAGEHD